MRHRAHMFAIAMAVVALTNLARAGDREVAEQIAGKLQASGQLRGFDVRVKFDRGTVCLRGRVATPQQVSAALALAQRTKGVKKVVNGLIVRAEPRRESRMTPAAPRQSVDYAVAQARLVPGPAPRVPIPGTQPNSRPSLSAAEPSDKPELGDRQVASGDVTPSTSVPDAVLAFPEPGVAPRLLPERRPPEPLCSLEYATTFLALPSTVQKACFSDSTGHVHVTDLHLEAARAGFAEPITLPGESGSPVGEAFVSDEPQQPHALPAGTDVMAAIPSAKSTSQSKLIQPLLGPVRRQWTGGFHENSLSTMRASVDISP